jgi:hypothetical protein
MFFSIQLLNFTTYAHGLNPLLPTPAGPTVHTTAAAALLLRRPQ